MPEIKKVEVNVECFEAISEWLRFSKRYLICHSANINFKGKPRRAAACPEFDTVQHNTLSECYEPPSSLEIGVEQFEAISKMLDSKYRKASIVTHYRQLFSGGDDVVVVESPSGRITISGLSAEDMSEALSIIEEIKKMPPVYPDFKPRFTPLSEVAKIVNSKSEPKDVIARIARNAALAVERGRLECNVKEPEPLLMEGYTAEHVAAFVIDLVGQQGLPGSWDKVVSKLSSKLTTGRYMGDYNHHTLYAIMGVLISVGAINPKKGVPSEIIRRLEDVENRTSDSRISSSQKDMNNAVKKFDNYTWTDIVVVSNLTVDYVRRFSQAFVEQYSKK